MEELPVTTNFRLFEFDRELIYVAESRASVIILSKRKKKKKVLSTQQGLSFSNKNQGFCFKVVTASQCMKSTNFN